MQKFQEVAMFTAESNGAIRISEVFDEGTITFTTTLRGAEIQDDAIHIFGENKFDMVINLSDDLEYNEEEESFVLISSNTEIYFIFF